MRSLSFPGSSPITGGSKANAFILVIKLEGWATSVIKKLNSLESRGPLVAGGVGQAAPEQEGVFQQRQVFKV